MLQPACRQAGYRENISWRVFKEHKLVNLQKYIYKEQNKIRLCQQQVQ